MNPLPAILGILLGAGVLLVVMGIRTLSDKQREDAARKRGFWPLNAGLIMIAVSVYLFMTGG